MMNEYAKDNYFKECPAIMNYSQMTDYRMAESREQNIRTINRITRDDEHRLLLQKNGKQMMDNDWAYFKMNQSCISNKCFHKYLTKPTVLKFNEKIKLYNKRTKEINEETRCETLDDYRIYNI